jgi:hypothetical protein
MLFRAAIFLVTTFAILPCLSCAQVETTADFTFDNGTNLGAGGLGFSVFGDASISGNQLQLDGTGDYLTITNPFGVGVTDNFALEAVVTAEAATVGGFNFIFAMNEGTSNNGFGGLLQSGSTIGIGSGQGPAFFAATPTGLLPRTFSVSVVRQNGNNFLYVDGVIFDDGVADGLNGAGSLDTLAIGAHNFDAPNGLFNGSIDRVRLVTFGAFDVLSTDAGNDNFLTAVTATELMTYGDMDVLGTGSYVSDPRAGATLVGLNADEVTFGGPEINHTFPFSPENDDFQVTDQIFTSSNQTASGDGYSAFPDREVGPQEFVLDYSSLLVGNAELATITLGIAADDFQFPLFGQPFTASINGIPNQTLTDTLNGLDQTGPQVQFFTIGLDVSSMDSSNELLVSIDQNGDGRDGWAVDFLTVGVTTFILGDSNQDGEVNFLDIAPFIGFLASSTFLAEADCNQDGAVSFLDINPFIEILAGS